MTIQLLLLYCIIFERTLGQNTTADNTTNATTTELENLVFNYQSSGSDWTGTCTTGNEQSPIDLEVAKGTCDNSMVLDIQFSKDLMNITIVKNEHTIIAEGSISNLYATDVNGDLFGYQALQFHFHAPSEHYIEGKQYDLEMHILHEVKPEFKPSQRTFAALSILFELSDAPQPFLDAYSFSNLTDVASETETTTTPTTAPTTPTTPTANSTTNSSEIKNTFKQFNFSELLGSQIEQNPIYYTYEGSYTAPPCSEVVQWYILDKILPITQAQMNSFNQYFSSNLSFANGNGNNRDLKALNDRVVKKGGVVCEEQFVYFFSFFILYIFINYFIFKLL